MNPKARIIGFGQRAAGDDGVGRVVLDHLAHAGLPPEVELSFAEEASQLIDQVTCPCPVWIVDALLSEAGPPGRLAELQSEDLDATALQPLSTHGMSVKQAIELARTLYPERVSPEIRILGITIARPAVYEHQLSVEVASAAERAAERIRAQLLGVHAAAPHF